MATKEEIIQKYQEDRAKKLLQLQTTLSSRIAQNAKVVASNENGVSVISTTATIDDFISPDRILANLEGQDTQVISDLRENFVRKNSSKDEPFAYLVLSAQVYFQSQTEINIRISENIFLKNPGEEGDGSRIAGVMGITKRESNINSFIDLSKLLSAYSIPIEQLVANKKFRSYLKNINDKLKSIDSPITVETFPVLVYSTLVVPDGTKTNSYNAAFPKPDGLDGESSPATTGTGTTGTGTATTGTGTTGTGTVTTGTGTTEVGTTASPQTEQTGSVKKYLSIEAIKDDDPVVPTETTSSRVLSLRYLDDAETSTDGYSSSSQINQLQTDTAQSRATEPPITPTSEQNKDVLEKEAEELRKRTEAQRKAEEADALEKETTKIKSSNSPVGSNPGLSDGKKAETDKKNQPIPPDKIPPPSEKSNSQLPSFTVWVKKYGQPTGDEPFIYNRIGQKEVPYLATEKDTRVDEGLSSPEKYKSLFDYGKSLDKFFDGYGGRIKSPVDVALLCNTVYVGGFNKNIPYTFDEGSETQLVMIGAYRDSSKKGLLGTAPATKKNKIEKDLGSKVEYLDKNWSENPYWCGLTVDFLLYSNKQYISDDIKLPIVSTGAVVEYFTSGVVNKKNGVILSNPSVNPPGGTEKAKNNEIEKLQTKIGNKQREITTIDTELKKLEKNKSNQIEKITKLQSDNLVNPSDVGVSKEKSARTILDGIQNSINAKNESRIQIQDEINQLEQEIKNIKNRPSSKYIENGMIAKFENGIHYKKNEGLTNEGKELWEQIKNWPGAYIVKRSPGGGHVELILHFGSNGRIFVIFGNSGYNETPPNRNGQKIDFKFYNDMYEFGGGGDVYVVKRGEKNPYTNGIGFTVKKTELYNEYVERINSGDKKIDPRAYNNVLRNIMEI